MNFVELTRPDDSVILINKGSIVSVVTYGTNTVLLLSGGHRQEVKETYNEVKSLLVNNSLLLKEEKNECSCK